jgi:hypothetical protein
MGMQYAPESSILSGLHAAVFSRNSHPNRYRTSQGVVPDIRSDNFVSRCKLGACDECGHLVHVIDDFSKADFETGACVPKIDGAV